MFIDKQHFERWMHHLEERLDRIEKLCVTLSEPKPSILPEGEKLLDNAEMCRMLNISKRTLQRRHRTGLSQLPVVGRTPTDFTGEHFPVGLRPGGF